MEKINMDNKDHKTLNDANYDRVITSAETAARIEREGDNFKQISEPGQTIDREGLANNYAIEPEMYYEQPGDLREKQEAEKERRAEELKDINTPGGKGVGII